jgi:hypothetical protein
MGQINETFLNNLSIEDLDALPDGSEVLDSDGDDRWVKHAGLWDCKGFGSDSFYAERTAEDLVDRYGPIRMPEPEVTTEPEPEPDGIWVIWSNNTRESVVMFEKEEIKALRFVNGAGYGWVEFVPFGQEV